MIKTKNIINRKDMLELTRRMTLARNSVTRIAGCYADREGIFDGSFNINFLKSFIQLLLSLYILLITSSVKIDIS